MKKNTVSIILIIFLFTTNYLYSKNPVIKSGSTKSGKSLAAGCQPATAATELDLNNVRTLILNGGDMWWDLSGNARYEIPKGSGKQALFAGSIWVGGTDVNGQLRFAAQRYRQDGYDYWPGPLVSSGDEIATVSPSVCIEYDRHYKIDRLEVEKFRAWYNSDEDTKKMDYPNYSVPEIIVNWPAHGPSEGEYDYYLAPFYDVNDDGYYSHADGDYPFFDLDGTEPCNQVPERRAENLNNTSYTLYGDQTLWWVYNDKGNIHTETTGAASIGMEIRAQAFAFSTNDELNNMTFYNYQIINRSTYTLKNTYFGVWTDADMGEHDDDYVGCDVNKGLGYLYNGDEDDGDGNGDTYGHQPPAIGIDFFEGPYLDANDKDDASNWDNDGNLDCNNGYAINPDTDEREIVENDLFNGNINGLNFGDGIKDNERWGMRRFIFFNNGGGIMGDPKTALEHYNYLKGIWKDNVRMNYGSDGHDGDINTPADFMFPDDTDPCGWGTLGNPQQSWSEYTENNPPDDRRFVQSAGPFILEPGAVNDITLGAVWARATTGGPWASVGEVRRADNKAQKLFEACFQKLDGPQAPDVTIIELDKKFIFHLSNKKRTNNYLEQYHKKDPFIECPVDEEGNTIDCDIYYSFQGYQVFQLKNHEVSISDIHNLDLARLVFQCDLADDVSMIVNYEWDDEIAANIPIMEVNGANEGIQHTFTITDDYFASGDRRLVNHKTYYYMAIAYAHNDYKHYDQNDPNSILDGQKVPYKASDKGIVRYEAFPHLTTFSNDGTIINADYGEGPEVEMLEGHGNGNNHIDLTQETVDDIMSGGKIVEGEPSWKANHIVYEESYAPIKIKVIDPLNVVNADFVIKFEADSINPVAGHNAGANSNSNLVTGLIYDTKWKIYKYENGIITDSILSDNWIRYEDEKLIPQWGISVTIAQCEFPGIKSQKFNDLDNKNNGYIGSSIEYEDKNNPWLTFLADEEGAVPLNWIRSGSAKNEEAPEFNDYGGRDNDQIYEKVVDGTWGPYVLSSKEKFGPAYSKSNPATLLFYEYRLASIDFVITKDRSKWTRCCVVELSDDELDDDENTVNYSEGGVFKFCLRDRMSLNKDGVASTDSTISDNEDDPNYIGWKGMSWFPGYAIDVETGERLNIIFGEDSRLVGDNGADMLWNPSWRVYENLYIYTGGQVGKPIIGGKHYIYVVGHNKTLSSYMPAYDYGKRIYEKLNGTSFDRADAFQHPVWVSIPTVKPEYLFTSYDDMPDNDLTVKIRIANPYFVGLDDFAIDGAEYSNYPSFKFSTSAISATKGDVQTAKDALELVNIVPNPYYGYSNYELSQLENIVKITNLPEKCTISIYNISGTQILRIKKDNELTCVDWDLKNKDGISIASGVYIIHIDAYEFGQKIIKWFGSLRPIDLNAF
ncbi:MAG: T9SS type A sorting domain-containing protein [Bacteroidales bacterium]|nr:T9SS type A sorting domain-containing protein [Bacteroidales bacterium]